MRKPFLASLIVFLLLTVFVAGKAPENLALGKAYEVEMRYLNSNSLKDETNYPDKGGELTDGKYGSLNFGDSAWTGFAQGFERHILLDLGEIVTVDAVSANFLQNTASGIRLPRWVLVEISADGNHFEEAGRIEYPLKPEDTTIQTVKYELKEVNLAGRYVRLTVPVQVWVFMDEFEVYGYKGIVGDARLVEGNLPLSLLTDQYIKRGTSDVGYAEHIMLIHIGHTTDWGNSTWTEEEFLPYVTYVVDNSPKDWFFDTFLFIPLRYASSGHSYTETNSIVHAPDMYDWKELSNWLFLEDKQLDALNNAVGQAKEALNDKDYKAKVILTTIYPSPVSWNFGDIDDDFISENLLATRGDEAILDGKKVAKWYLDLLLNKWQEKDYENLELIGFYWLQEEVVFEYSKYEEAVIIETARLIHEAGYKFFWIPYIRGGLYYDWQRLGFDAAMMQPNWMWTDLKEDLLKTNAELTKAAGMGVEMESNAFHSPESDQKWLDYLNAGVKYGYMHDALLSYYQNVKDVLKASKLDDYNRTLYYDYLYEFVKGTYTYRDKVE